MAEMFYGAMSFNHSVADWDVADVTTMASMFEGASAFNSSVDGPRCLGLDHGRHVRRREAFNQAIDWPTTLPQLTSTARMFEGASNFNSAVDLGMDGVTDARRMFAGATSFDQPLDWDTGTVTTMSDMFAGAVMFNQDLSSWDFEQVTRFNSFLNGTSLGIPQLQPAARPVGGAGRQPTPEVGRRRPIARSTWLRRCTPSVRRPPIGPN